MYDIEKLNNKKVAELREIAEKLNIQKVDKLKKQELVYKILDEQAMNPKKRKKQNLNHQKKDPFEIMIDLDLKEKILVHPMKKEVTKSPQNNL